MLAFKSGLVVDAVLCMSYAIKVNVSTVLTECRRGGSFGCACIAILSILIFTFQLQMQVITLYDILYMCTGMHACVHARACTHTRARI
jgi:hypothetical protein